MVPTDRATGCAKEMKKGKRSEEEEEEEGAATLSEWIVMEEVSG